MKLYVIGDIHGCYDEMMKILGLIEDHAEDSPHKIVFIGDYIDRGPNSSGVLDELVKRSKDPKYVFIRGNHDLMPFEDRMTWAMNGGGETLSSYRNGTFEDDYFPEDHIKFLKSTRLYYQHWIPSENRYIVCVHAGINPDLPMEDQNDFTMVWTRNMVGYKGDYHDNYFVVHGHTPLKGEVLRTNNTLNIDTACVFGYNLTCAVFDNSTKPEFLTVKSEFNFLNA